MQHRFVARLLAALALLTACGDIPATNPYDPATPGPQQQPATLEGLVGRPDGVPRSYLSRVRAVLTPLGDAGLSRQEVALDEGGRFLFDAVFAGTWRLSFDTPGMRAPVVVVSLAIGERLDLGRLDLELEPVAGPGAPPPTRVQSAAQLDCGAPPCDHSGVRVEAVGWPSVALTNADGAFSLNLIEGTHELRFGAAGYQPFSLTGVSVESGETLVLPAEPPIVLAFVPGELTGLVERSSTASAPPPRAPRSA